MNLRPSRRNEGNILLTALLISLVVGLSLMAYLSWTSSQHHLVMRSQSWNAALPLAEAGIEEAMTHISTTTNWASRGWTLSNGFYVKKRAVGDGFFISRIEDSPLPRIFCEGHVPAPLGRSRFITRRVVIRTTNDPIYFGAIVSDRHIDLNGNNVYIDSYDSTDPNKSAAGLYDPLKRDDNGTIATNLGITNSVNVGNANVYGKVLTAPGGSALVGPNGAVGSTAWHAAGNSGIQPGWFRDDFNLPMESPPEAPSGGLTPLSGRIGVNNFDYVLTDGIWEVSDLKGKSVYVGGDATLVVKGDVDLSSVQSILMVETNASLKMHVLGKSSKIVGENLMNQSGIPDRLHYYGGPNNETMIMSGGLVLGAVIHAPQAELQIGGGGGTPIHLSGSVIAKNVTFTGRINMHFDESLRRKYTKGYIIASWNEL